MSIHKLHLNVFRFDASKDYNPSYEKCDFDYQEDFLLSNVLQSLPLRDFLYDKSIALKINNIAIFADLKVTDLVGRFGQEWVLEPISIKYALKDLVIDRQAVLSFYDTFLRGGDFLTPTEKTELSKFLNINFISPQRNPDYFGDGFFLYVKWLLGRHPNNAKRLLQSISDPKNGVMNFVSVKKFVYPQNAGIDQEIFEIQKMLTQASKCPFAGSDWAKFSKNIETKYEFTPFSGAQKDFKKSSYAIFNGYEKNWNSRSLILSTSELLQRLGLEVLDVNFCFDGGYWGRFCDYEKFLLANAYNMALAYQNGAVLLLPDEDAYANVIEAKRALDSDNALLETINEKLKQYALRYDPQVQIQYINEMIVNELKWDVSQSFNGFATTLFGGSFGSQVNEICYDDFFKKIALKRYQTTVQNESYVHLFDVNENSALIQSAAIRYEAIDFGSDFLLSTSMGQFEMFDTFSKKASKVYRRDFDPTPVLFLAQLVLLCMGEKDPKKIGLCLHKNKVSFI